MLKKTMLLSLSVVAALALAIPAFASAAEVKDGGVPVASAHLHLHGNLTLRNTSSGASITCTVTATVTFNNSTNGNASFSFSNCTTNFGCEATAEALQEAEVETGGAGEIIVRNIKFEDRFAPSPPCPAGIVAEGELTAFVNSPITQASFTEAGSGMLETSAGSAGVSGTLEVTEGAGTYEVS